MIGLGVRWMCVCFVSKYNLAFTHNNNQTMYDEKRYQKPHCAFWKAFSISTIYWYKRRDWRAFYYLNVSLYKLAML